MYMLNIISRINTQSGAIATLFNTSLGNGAQMMYGVLWTPISTLRNQKSKASSLPLTLVSKDLNLAEFNSERALALTGTFSPRAGYTDYFNAVCVDKPFAKSHDQFHNGIFVAWDIETLAINGVERAYIVSWVVSKGNSLETGVVNHLNSDWKSDEGQLLITKEFFKGMMESVRTINNGKVPKVLYMYAHNSGLFDLHVLLPSIIKIHSESSKMMAQLISDRDNDIYQLRVEYIGTSLLFRDRMKILPMSLKSVGLNMLAGDVGKLSVNHDAMREVLNSKDAQTLLTQWNDITVGMTGDIELWKAYATPMAYIEDYCLQDSIVVSKALKKFSLELSRKGYVVPLKKCITASSIGMSIWKAYFNSYEQPIIQIHMNTKLQGELNKAYIGGRVEVYDSGLEMSPIYHFDVPGLYAGIMQKELPIGNPVYLSNFNEEGDITWINELSSKGLIGFVKCQVQAPANLNIPVLPIKYNGKLTFPIGEFTGTWSTVELVKALEVGYIVKPLEAWIFKSGTPLKSYAETLTNLKDLAGREGNKTLRTVMKLLTNSLYGKFASKYFLTTTEIVKSDNIPILKELYKINSITKIDIDHMIVNHDLKPIANANVDKDLLNGAYDRSSKALADKDLNIAIAATVTAYGRVQLYRLIQEIQERGGKLCYTDTDSVFAWLPESPIDKPFGPYTWVGPASEHTLTKALFIAPKMYYHEDMRGKVTFKVKGVNTKNSNLTYEQLCELFITKSSIKFTDQTQYRRIPKMEGIGVIITENLDKAYILQIDSKRTWNLDAGKAWTTPFLLNRSILTSTKAIKELSECRYDLIANTIRETAQLSPFKPTTDQKVIVGNITQELSWPRRRIVISIPILDIKESFNMAWAHLLSTAAHNTKMFENSRKVKWLQILVKDDNAKVWKTLIFFKDINWIGYTTKEVYDTTLRQIINLNVEYDSAYNWTTLAFKIEFDGMFELVQFSSEMPIYKLQQDLKEATKAYNQELALQKEMQNTQAKLDTLKTYRETTKQLMDLTLSRYELVLNNFTTKITKDLYNEFKNMDGLDTKALNFIHNAYILDTELTIDETRMVIADIVINSLKLVLRNTFKIEYHTWVNTYMKLAKLDLTKEHHIRHTLSLIHLRMVILEDKGYISTWIKGKVVMDGRKNFKTTPHMINLSNDWSEVTMAIQSLGILSKIRFIPTNLKYNPESTDQVLKSYDKVEQINTLNNVKVFLHPLYKDIIYKLLPKTPEEIKTIQNWLGIKDAGKINAHIVEIETVANTIVIINHFIDAFQQKFYFNNFFADTRGRVYPELRQFRHIGSKWLRPLFCLEKSAILLNTFPTLYKQLDPRVKPSELMTMSIYWVQVAEIFNIELRTIKTPQEMLDQLKAQITRVLNPQLTVRIIEIEEIINKGFIEVTAPFQVDMKNNAIQHSATIVGNEYAMKATGVMPTNVPLDDMYTKVAKAALTAIQQDPINPINEEILKTLDPADPNTMKILRNIAKRPTIVIIYSATQRTIGEYVYEALKDNNVTLSKDARILLAKTIINKAFEFLSQEVALMKELKNIINKEMAIISWHFGGLSDYMVKDTYFKLENKDIKLSHGNKQFHTSYNIITAKVDKLAMKNALFVNIIHSLDALHLMKTLKILDDKNIFTIHDAYLINWRYNKADLFYCLRKAFIEIHNNNFAIDAIIHRLSQTTGRNISWQTISKKLNISPPKLTITGNMAA